MRGGIVRVAALPIVALVIVGVAALANRPAGQREGNLGVADPSPRVALVGDEVVSQADVLQEQVLMGSEEDSSRPTRRVAFEALVRDMLLAAEARRRGLGIEEGAAAALAASHRHLYEQGLLPDQEDVRHLIAALGFLGLTEDMYWRELAPRFYRRAYSAAALRSRVGDGLDRLYLRLRREAGVVILDQAFLDEEGSDKGSPGSPR